VTKKFRANLISFFFLLFWLVMISLLLGKEGYLSQKYLTMTSSSQSLPFREEWFAILYQEKKVGYVYQVTRPSPRKNTPYELYSRMKLSLFLLGEEIPVILEGSSFLNRKYQLENLSYSLNTYLYQVEIEGERKGSFLELEVKSPGGKIKKKIKIGKKAFANTLMPSLLAGRKLVPGTSFSIPVFDPLSLNLGEAKIEVLAFPQREGRELFRLRMTYQGIITESLVTKEGEVLEAETPFGLKFKKTSRELALGKLEKQKIPELLKKFSIQYD